MNHVRESSARTGASGAWHANEALESTKPKSMKRISIFSFRSLFVFRQNKEISAKMRYSGSVFTLSLLHISSGRQRRRSLVNAPLGLDFSTEIPYPVAWKDVTHEQLHLFPPLLPPTCDDAGGDLQPRASAFPFRAIANSKSKPLFTQRTRIKRIGRQWIQSFVPPSPLRQFGSFQRLARLRLQSTEFHHSPSRNFRHRSSRS